MNRFLCIILVLFSSFSWSTSTSEIRKNLTYLYGEYEIYESFYYKLTEAILQKDPKTVASMNMYPIRVNSASGTVYIKTEQEFISQFDSIVNKKMMDTVKSQKFEDLFANSTGMHIGLGDIWFTGYCTGTEEGKECDTVIVKVMAYNVK
ncbi:hypothetical protein J7384_18835 [Endozoicomonas sp. G2_1]|uniref:hypothetical protein n=1 Tax=Endozoicomonas sp. G2_1 TaxID=2821091 RepID=UPI001ADD2251|nr:hypothetical protein [Endozoicomonas sp. G2_1]MBO9492425.1 hypothetical protein [Endozoicomonas sp. G2_1]